MQNLFVIDGASGVGKSDLLRWVVDNAGQHVVHLRKGTTRQQREYERTDDEILLDLDFLTEDEFSAQAYDYIYSYGGARYGFHAKALTEALIAHDNVFVIVRNTATIQRLCRDYGFINVVPMFVYTDRAELQKRMADKGLSEDQMAFRLQRSDLALRDYYARPETYREVIINCSARDVFHQTVDRLVSKYDGIPRIAPFTIPVMMSFNSDNKKLDDYYDAMVAAVQGVSKNYRCHRVDRVPGSPKIAHEFRSLAATSRCAIVDLTENKQNVYYELGYLQALGRTCVITAENGTALSFYPREYKVVFYASARELREKLLDELRGVLLAIPGM
jgi:guanylate kinase